MMTKTPDERLDAAVLASGGAPKSDEALRRLARAAREELAAHPKARPWWMDGLVLLALNLVMGLGAAAAMSWSDLQHGSMTMRSVVAVAWLLMMSVGSVLWLRPGAMTSRLVVGAGFVIASVLAIGGASGFDPGAPFFRGMGCAFVECSVALIPVSVLLVLSTHFAATASHVFVGALAAASGGALALHLHCSNGTIAHIAAFHLLPAVVLGGVAVLIRRKLRTRTLVP
ncbi:MAG: hypothetical protein Q8K32_01945 [Archangium sp.]|nr:hypothetical protein [Archangium sp.]